ncbi:MAG TPA: CNP1-like family protein [Burkholderiales bacterium]|nr:CNP1-like family protein [Burkholderiales bacterium]
MRFQASALVLPAVLAIVFSAATASAQQGSDFESDFDENKKDWKEIEAKIPAYPKNEDLVAFGGGPASGHRFFLDAKSLSIGSDGVVRYTLIIKTAGGATNVSYEGIRCETHEQKYYAVGQTNGSWTRARNPAWRPIRALEVNRQHSVLYNDYLCDGGTYKGIPASSVRQILQGMKYGQPQKVVE